MIDTVAKRASALGYVLPDGAIDIDDRATLLDLYGGGLKSANVGPLTVTVTSAGAEIDVSSGGPVVTVT